jgi:hypothetical protein
MHPYPSPHSVFGLSFLLIHYGKSGTLEWLLIFRSFHNYNCTCLNEGQHLDSYQLLLNPTQSY